MALLLMLPFRFRPIRTVRPILLLNFTLYSINTGSDTILLLRSLNFTLHSGCGYRTRPLTELVYCIKSGSGTALMLTLPFLFRPVRTAQPILLFLAGSGFPKINTNSGTGTLTPLCSSILFRPVKDVRPTLLLNKFICSNVLNFINNLGPGTPALFCFTFCFRPVRDVWPTLLLTHYPPRVDASTTWLYLFENLPKIHLLIYCFHIWTT